MQQRGLAASGRPHNAEKLARLNLQVDVVKRQKPLPALGPVAEAYFAQADLGESRARPAQRVATEAGRNLASRAGRRAGNCGGRRVMALDHINLEVKPGEFLCVVGPSDAASPRCCI